MKKSTRTPLLCILLVLLFGVMGCGTKESIQPTWNPEPLDKQLEQKPFEVSIPIDGLKVEEFGAEFREVAELGPLFQELAHVFANVAIEEENGQLVEIDPVIYFAPELDQVDDWERVRKIALKKVKINIANAEDLELASLGFIKDLKVYLDFVLPATDQVDRQGRGILIASYNKIENAKDLGCLERCLDLTIHDIDWKRILETERTFVIYTELEVEEVPTTKMEIGGELGVTIGINLGI